MKSITIDITDRCHLQCTTCNKWKTNPTLSIEKELTTKQWKQTLDKLVSYYSEGISIIFSGGEPFIREDIFEIASYAKSKGIDVRSMTNGYHIEHLYEKIVDSDIKSINVSLNSINDPEIHNKSRGKADAYEQTIKTLKELLRLNKEKEARMNIGISTIIIPENLDELIPLAEFANENNITILYQLVTDEEAFHSYLTHSFCDTQNYELPEKMRIKYQQMKDRLPEIFEKLKRLHARGYKINTPRMLLDSYVWYVNHIDEVVEQFPCQIKDSVVAIDPYGNVRHCFNMAPIGNVLENDLETIFNSDQAKQCLEDIKTCKMHCRLLACNFKRQETFIEKVIKRIYYLITPM